MGLSKGFSWVPNQLQPIREVNFKVSGFDRDSSKKSDINNNKNDINKYKEENEGLFAEMSNTSSKFEAELNAFTISKSQQILDTERKLNSAIEILKV